MTGSRDDRFLQFMRDQGAQRAYRNVAGWLKTDPILDVLGRIEVELTIIDARREAFHRGKEIHGQEQADQWKKALEERKKAARPAARKSKPKRRRPTR